MYRTSTPADCSIQQERSFAPAFCGVATALECLLHLFLRLRSRLPPFLSLRSSPQGERRRHSFSGNAPPFTSAERERVRFFSLETAGRGEGAPWPWGQFLGRFRLRFYLVPLSPAVFHRESVRCDTAHPSSHYFSASCTYIVINCLSARARVPFRFCEVNCRRRIVDGPSVVYMYSGTRNTL